MANEEIAHQRVPVIVGEQLAQDREIAGEQGIEVVVEEFPIDGHAALFHVGRPGPVRRVADVGGKLQLAAYEFLLLRHERHAWAGPS